MNAKTFERLDDISTHFRLHQFIALNGTTYQIPSDVIVGHTQTTVENHIVIQVGWAKRSQHTNKSCGVSLLIDRRLFAPQDIKAIDVGPISLRGRVMSVRIKKANHFDATVINMYFPPCPSRTVDRVLWLETTKLLFDWLETTLSECRGRTTPIIMCDLNDKFVQAHKTDGIITVGDFISTGKSNGSAERFKRILKKHDLAVLTTHAATPPTYVGSSGSGSRIDHVAIPSPLIAEAKSRLKVVVEYGKAVQATPYCTDHRPVSFIVPMSLPVAKTPKAELRWDSNLIADAMKTGRNRSQCLQDIEASLLEHEAAFRMYRADQTPERHNKLLIEIINTKALKYYSAKASVNPEQEEDRKTRKELLSRRRESMKQFLETPAENTK